MQNTMEQPSGDGQLDLFGASNSGQLPLKRERRKRETDWVEVTRALLESHFRYAESVESICQRFTIPRAVVESRIAEMQKIPNSWRCTKDFGFSKLARYRYPKRSQQKSTRELAARIGARLQILAPRDPIFFRDTIQYFAEHIQESSRFILGVRDWQRYFAGEQCVRFDGFRNIICLIDKLGIEGLEIEYLGWLKEDGTKPDWSSKLKAIGARRGTEVRIVRPSNAKSKSNHEQLGMVVVNRVQHAERWKLQASDAFRHVMVLALVRKIWLTPEQESDAYLYGSDV